MKKHLPALLCACVLILSGCGAPAPAEVSSAVLNPPTIYIYQVENDGERDMVFGIDNGHQQLMGELSDAFFAEAQRTVQTVSRPADYVVCFADQEMEQTMFIKVWLEGETLIFRYQSPLHKLLGDDEAFYQSESMTGARFREILSS